MNKILISVLVIFSLALSGCKWFNTDQIKSDLTNAKENATEKVREVKEGVEVTVEKVSTTVKETKENVENAIEEVKETTAEIKEAKDAVDEAFGKVKDIGAEEETEAEPMSASKQGE